MADNIKNLRKNEAGDKSKLRVIKEMRMGERGENIHINGRCERKTDREGRKGKKTREMESLFVINIGK
jgi:hypothetical protein